MLRARGGRQAADLARKHGLGGHIYDWKTKHSGLEVSHANHLKALKVELNKLMELLAKKEGRAAERQAAAHLQSRVAVLWRLECWRFGYCCLGYPAPGTLTVHDNCARDGQ